MTEKAKLTNAEQEMREARMIANFNARVNAPETGKKMLNNVVDEQNITQEVGGPKGLEPTRYGDWETKGRCYDF